MLNVRNFFTLNIVSAFSKCTGFIRDILIARRVPDSPISAGLMFAMSFSFYLRRVLAEGTFDSSFITLAVRSKNYRRLLTHCAIGVMAFSMLTYGLIFTFASDILSVFGPGVQDRENALFFLRVTTLYFLTSPLAYVLTGALQLNKKFFIYSIMPVLLNLSFIALTIMTSNVYIISCGFFVGGIIQLMLAIIFVRRYLGRPTIKAFWSDLHSYSSALIPMMFYGLIIFGNMGVMLHFATMYGITYAFYFVDRFRAMPISLLGNVLGIVILPTISALYSKASKANGEFKQEHVDNINQCFNQMIKLGILLSIPTVAGIFAVSDIIAISVFDFNANTLYVFSYYLQLCALIIPAAVLTRICQSFMYANLKIKTYLGFGFLGLLCNISFASILSHVAGFAGVVIASVLVQYGIVTLVVIALRLKVYRSSVIGLLKSILHALVMYFIVITVKEALPLPDVLRLIICTLLGIAVYMSLSYFDIKETLFNIKKGGNKQQQR